MDCCKSCSGLDIDSEREGEDSDIDNSIDIRSVSQVTKDGEDHQSGKDRGEGVADADNEGVPVTIVTELVVAGERQLAAVAHREGEKYL